MGKFTVFLTKAALEVKMCMFVLVLVLFASAGYIFSHPLSADSYVHLAIGKYVVENKRIPTHNDISYKEVEPSYEYISHSWFSDVVFYLAHSVGIEFLAIFVVFGLLLLSLFLLYKIFEILEIGLEARLISLSLASLLSLSFWKAHPLIFATPILLAMVLIYIDWVRKRSKVIWFLPLAFFLFANLSGGYIYLPVSIFLLVVTGHILLAFFFKKHTNITLPKGSLWSLLLSFASFLVAGLFNPNTFLVYSYVAPTVSVLSSARKLFSTLAGSLKILNQNFIKDSESSLLYSLFLIYFLTTVLLVAVLTVRYKSKYFSTSLFIIPLVFAFLFSLVWIRFLAVVVFLTMPIFAVSFGFTINQYRRALVRSLVIYGALVVLVFGFLGTILGLNEGKIRKSAEVQVSLIEDLNLADNVLTSPDLTGYLLFKTDRKALLDVQDDLYDENEQLHFYIYEPYISAENFDLVAEKNNIDTLLIDKDYGQLSRTLGQSDNWSLLYFDDTGFLYTKKNSSNKLVEENALRYVDFSSNLGFDPKEATPAALELEKFSGKYPQNYMAKGQLASIYRFLAQYPKAEELLNSIPENERNFVVYTEMGRLAAAQGKCRQSEDYFLKALDDRDEKNFSRAVLDIAVVYAVCLKDKQKATHYFARYDSFALPPEERDRVKKIMTDLGIKINSQ